MQNKSRLLFIVFFSLFIFACKQDKDKQTMLSGDAKIYVDKSIFPITEDLANVFQNTYTQAEIRLIALEENQLINKIIQDSVNLFVLPRLLTSQEEKVFTDKQITPRITRFGIDAVAFIVNKNTNDSVVSLKAIENDLKKVEQLQKILVFDNPNSSTTNTLFRYFNLEVNQDSKLYSKESAEELIKFVASNQDCIGVVSLNWLTQAPLALDKFVKEIRVLGVTDIAEQGNYNQAIFPIQSNLANKQYPLTRELFLLNYQGTSGLGMGFASFIASDVGQKIMLTSGLAPMEVNQMKINVVK